jgi:hypothetical protein
VNLLKSKAKVVRVNARPPQKEEKFNLIQILKKMQPIFYIFTHVNCNVDILTTQNEYIYSIKNI